MNLVKEILEDPEARFVSKTGMLNHQLRQVRTRFTSPSTYTLCRASDPITKNYTCHPFTVFTLSERDRGHSSYFSINHVIANEVLKRHDNSVLLKKKMMKIGWNKQAVNQPISWTIYLASTKKKKMPFQRFLLYQLKSLVRPSLE